MHLCRSLQVYILYHFVHSTLSMLLVRVWRATSYSTDYNSGLTWFWRDFMVMSWLTGIILGPSLFRFSSCSRELLTLFASNFFHHLVLQLASWNLSSSCTYVCLISIIPPSLFTLDVSHPGNILLHPGLCPNLGILLSPSVLYPGYRPFFSSHEI